MVFFFLYTLSSSINERLRRDEAQTIISSKYEKSCELYLTLPEEKQVSNISIIYIFWGLATFGMRACIMTQHLAQVHHLLCLFFSVISDLSPLPRNESKAIFLPCITTTAKLISSVLYPAFRTQNIRLIQPVWRCWGVAWIDYEAFNATSFLPGSPNQGTLSSCIFKKTLLMTVDEYVMILDWGIRRERGIVLNLTY